MFFPSFGRTLTSTRSPSLSDPPRTFVAAVQEIGVSFPSFVFRENVFAFWSREETVPDIVIAWFPFAVETAATPIASTNASSESQAVFFIYFSPFDGETKETAVNAA
jgi:hypothetical protein